MFDEHERRLNKSKIVKELWKPVISEKYTNLIPKSEQKS